MRQSWTKFLPVAVIGVVAIVVVIAITTGDSDDAPSTSTTAQPEADPEAAAADEAVEPEAEAQEAEPEATEAPDPEAAPEPEAAAEDEAAEPEATEAAAPEAMDEAAEPDLEPEEAPPPPLDCTRNEILISGPCRPSAFEGDNGGATAPGVEADRIKVVVYRGAGRPQLGVLDVLSGVTRDADPEIYQAFADWFNDNFETYGRIVEIALQVGPSEGPSPANDVADATATATEEEAFIAYGATATDIYYGELARLERIGFAANTMAGQALMDERAPYQYSFSPTTEEVAAATAAYYCDRMHGQPAEFAGGSLQGAPRKVAVVGLDSPVEAGQTIAAALVDRCGAEAELYLSIPRGPADEVVQAMARWASDGVTTIIWADVPFNRNDYAAIATGQDYFPENLHTGIFLSGMDALVRGMDPEQSKRMFGIEVGTYPAAVESTAAARAFRAARPDGDVSVLDRDDVQAFENLLLVMYGIEAAGPDLNAATFESGLFSLDPIKPGDNAAAISFGDNGPGNRSAVDDYAEVWWNPEGLSTDGGVGTFYWVDGGRRYAADAWPSDPPAPGTADGSFQPTD